MSETPLPRLMLFTPPLGEVGDINPRLEKALGSGDIAAVLLRLLPLDERAQINIIKGIAQVVQAAGAALVVQADPSIAVRGGADGVHVEGNTEMLKVARDTAKSDRIVGAGGLKARHDAMDAGEAGCDYVMFGEPRPDGYVPPLSGVIERTSWWSEIFQTPCVAYAPDMEAISALAATGCEFIALGDWVLMAQNPAQEIATALTMIKKQVHLPGAAIPVMPIPGVA
jgi:thiamine-phosphate pyrophosphorylase